MDFTPKEKTEAIRGYRFNFIDEDMSYPPERGVGGESFNAWVSPENLHSFGMNGPEDMPLLIPYIGKEVDVHFSRGKGKVDGWNVCVHAPKAAFPPDALNKPNKLA